MANNTESPGFIIQILGNISGLLRILENLDYSFICCEIKSLGSLEIVNKEPGRLVVVWLRGWLLSVTWLCCRWVMLVLLLWWWVMLLLLFCGEEEKKTKIVHFEILLNPIPRVLE